MSNSVSLSVLGLYTAEPTLFDNMSLPEGMDKTTVINAIIQDCAELEVLYASPAFMKVMIGVWSARERPTFDRIYKAESAEYNPIENYDRKQTDTREIQHSGNDVSSGSSSGQASDTSSATDNNLHKYAAFDSGSLAEQTKDERQTSETGSQTASQTVQNTLTHGEKVGETFTSNIHGNIGVTTSQQMLESELDIAPKINTINYVVNSFKMRFCLLVY